MRMIRHTFIHLDGMGPKTEQRLWAQGIITWQEFLARPEIKSISTERKELMDEVIAESARRLMGRDASYFKAALKSSEHWRLYRDFRDDAAYLDIETNGLAPDAGGVPTMVGIYTRDEYRVFIRGRDLTTANVMEALSGAKLMVSFFGSVFDIPFLERTLPGFHITIPHYDLCFAGKKIGLSGGLKNVERAIGIHRPDEVAGMDGYAAVVLWQRYMAGDKRALETLIMYNREDTINLVRLADTVYDGLWAQSRITEFI